MTNGLTGDGGVGALTQAIAMPYYSTQKQQEYASSFLTDWQERQEDWTTEEELIDQVRQREASSLEVLKRAQERLRGAKGVDPAEMWLAASAAFGAPTRTGAFGETMGMVAENLREPLQRKTEFERERMSSMDELEMLMAQSGQATTGAEMSLAKMRRAQEASMAEQAFKALGKPVMPPSMGRIEDVWKLRDTEFIRKEYMPFVSGGSADAVKAINELMYAQRALESGNPFITGPAVGSLANLPVIGKPLMDIFLPEGADIRELVESTVQRSLRPILGAQFTEKEGERLIARVYNPRLDEAVNSRRLGALIEQLKRAYMAKLGAAQRIDEYGTLGPIRGADGRIAVPAYEVQYAFTSDSFGPGTADWDSLLGKAVGEEEVTPQNLGDMTPEQIEEARQKVRDAGGTPEFQEGGRVVMQEVTLDDGTVVNVPVVGQPGAVRQQVDDPGMGDIFSTSGDMSGVTGREPSDIELMKKVETGLELGAGTVGGAGLGLATEAIVAGRQDPLSRPERQIVGAIERGEAVGGPTPVEVAQQVKRQQRMGVPTEFGDVVDRHARAMQRTALVSGGAEAEQAITGLQERRAGTPGRVLDHVNRGLKANEYFGTMDQLTDRLYERAAPLYEAAYKTGRGLRETELLTRILNETEEGQNAVRYAMKIYRMRGQDIGPVDATGVVRSLDLEFLDLVKRGFDQQAQTGAAVDTWGNPTDYGRELRNLRKQYRDEVDSIAPEEYRQARQQYAGDLEVLDSLQQGRDFHRQQPEELRRLATEMSFAERNAFRTGMTQKIMEMVENPSGDIDAARKLVGSDAMMKRLEPFFDKPREFRMFQAALEAEMKLWATEKSRIGAAERGREARAAQDLDIPATAVARIAPRQDSYLRFIVDFLNTSPEMGEDEADELIEVFRRSDIEEMDELIPRLREHVELEKRRGTRPRPGPGVGRLGKAGRLAHQAVRGRRGKAAGIGAVLGALGTYLMGEDEEAPDTTPVTPP
jgi:hypothetical protein